MVRRNMNQRRNMEPPVEIMPCLETCEIEATVVTGFESQAKEEVLEKLEVAAVTARGKINFHIPITKCKQILQLSSIDNAIVVIKRYENFEFTDNLECVLQQFRQIVREVNWEHGIKVWNQFFSFQYPISTQPKLAKSEPECCTDDATDGAISTEKNSKTDRSKLETDTSANDLPGDHSSSDLPVQSEGCEPAPKKVKQTDWNPVLPAFRATCYRNGKHIFQSPQAAASFGGEINNYFGWNVSMKNFDIEAILTIDNDNICVSLGLTRESLHRRNITQFGRTTLRPTIAYNMLRFCRLKDTEVVCDPMCGGGSIPVEAAINWPKSVHLCGDSYEHAAPMAKANIDAVNEKRLQNGLKNVSATLFTWDACNLPLKNESVDVFVTDMPFGKRSGTKMSNWHLYPRVLKEMARVCKRDTGRACLLTQDKKCLVKSLIPIESLWRRGPTIAINIGGLAAAVFLLHRTTRKFMTGDELEEDKRLRDEHRVKQQQHKAEQKELLQKQISEDT